MFITVRGKRVYYEAYGKGSECAVFVHGWGGSHRSLKKLAEKSAKKLYSVILDLPGFGKSQNPDPDWGVGEYAELVAAFMRELKLDRPVFFGHSFGGSLGIYIAANNLYTFSKLILCASSFKRTGKKCRLASGMNRLVNVYVPFLKEALAKTKPWLYKIFFRGSDLTKYPHLESNFRKIVAQDLSALPASITVPTLILWGARDTYTPPEFADELELKISNSKKVIFPHKTHNLPIRYPDCVWNEMKVFLGV